MDKKKLLIGGAALAVLLLILGAVVVSGSGKSQGPSSKRDNLLRLAKDDYQQNEYQRALDKLDQILVENPEDKEAKDLKTEVVQAKQDAERRLREADQDSQKSQADRLASLMARQQSPGLSTSGDEEAQRKAQREREEAARLEKERQEAARLSGEEKAKRDLLIQGRELMTKGLYPQARQKFDEVINKDPKMADAWELKGESFFLEDKTNKDKRQSALESLTKATSIDPNRAKAYGLMGDIHQEAKNFPDAVDNYKKSIRLNPDNADVLYQLGKVLFFQKKYPESAEAFQGCTRLDPQNYRAFNNMGSAWAQIPENKKAADAFSQAVKLKPDFAEGYHNLGKAQVGLGRADLGVESFKKAISLDDTKAAYQTSLGQAYFDLNRFSDAEGAYSRALAINPKDAQAAYNLSNAQLRQNKITPALENAQKAVELNGASALYFYHLGLVSEKAGSAPTAKSAYEKSIQLDKRYIPSRINIANLLEAEGNIDGALDQLLEAAKVAPADVRVNNNIGNILLKKKVYTQAIDFFRKALDGKPDNVTASQIRYNLGIAYIETNQKDLAKAVLQDLVRLSPTYWDAYYRLGSVLYALGEESEGKKIFQTLLEKNPTYEKKDEIQGILAK